MASDLNLRTISKFSRALKGDVTYTVARNAAVNAGVMTAASNPESARLYRNTYSIQVKAGEMTDQAKSGRCWIFAAYNVLRTRAMKKLKVENIEFSQAFGMFYDKLEKANAFLEGIIATADRPLNDRLVRTYLEDAAEDGGYWNMAVALIEKYGVVPKEAMPETASSKDSYEMNLYLASRLRAGACELRELIAQGASTRKVSAAKERILADIYRMLCICLGEPPQRFDFEIRNKDDKFIRATNLTPQKFYKRYIGVNLRDYLVLTHIPQPCKELGKLYEIRHFTNVVGDHPRAANVDLKHLVEASIAQLKSGEGVWFACDVDKNHVRSIGVLDTESVQAQQLFGVHWEMTKGEEFAYCETEGNHAMALMGVNLSEKGKPLSWRVENSWSKEYGKDGYLMMSQNWFDRYVSEVVVHKKHVPAEVRTLWKSEPILCDPWDAF